MASFNLPLVITIEYNHLDTIDDQKNDYEVNVVMNLPLLILKLIPDRLRKVSCC